MASWEHHSDKELIKNTDNKPLRIFLNANEDDMGKGRPEADHHDWVVANQRTAAARKAKKLPLPLRVRLRPGPLRRQSARPHLSRSAVLGMAGLCAVRRLQARAAAPQSSCRSCRCVDGPS